MLVIAGLINTKFSVIIVPEPDKIVQRQIDFITINTVFAGFSFTALGLLLGMSSEKLIEKIKNTSIIMQRVQRVVNSVILFILSVACSLVVVLGLNQIGIVSQAIQLYIDNIVYVLSVGYMIAGIVFFVWSVYDLFDLIKRVYVYNHSISQKKIEKAKQQLKTNKDIIREEQEELDN